MDRNQIKNYGMETFLVKHPKYDQGTWLGNTTVNGKEHYIVEWDSFLLNTPYTGKNMYIDKLPADECTLIRKPSRVERILILWLKRLMNKRIKSIKLKPYKLNIKLWK